MSEQKHLIIGLGNPGAAYVGTRHNIGFSVVSAFAKSYGFSFKRAARLHAQLAQGTRDDKRIFLLQPTTFVNESGLAVRQCVEYYEIPLEHLIVVSDDAALPVGKMRMRTKGSSGGHNGLKSIEEHLHTQNYARFRIGIGAPVQQEMKEYVLDVFGQQEKKVMEHIIAHAVEMLKLWVVAGIASAMQVANSPLA